MHSVKQLALLILIMAGAVTCGSSGGSGTSSGTIGGTTFSAPTAIAVYSSDPTDGNIRGISIVMSSSSSLCSVTQKGAIPKSSQYAELVLAVLDSNVQLQTPTATGTFTAIDFNSTTVPSGNVALFAAGTTTAADSNCTPAGGAPSARSGSAVLTSLGSRTANTEGTYNFTLDNNDVLTGTFSATPCIIDAALIDSDSDGPVSCD